MSLDPRIEVIRSEYGLKNDDFWKLPQGRDVWLVKHAALEVVAAKAGITFDMPEIIEARSNEGVAAICVRGFFGDRAIWSIGEASPKNCKNSYPWAIAEKRAIDRVILKLLGIHGLVYSEDESDDFKEPPVKSSAALKREGSWETILAELRDDFMDCHSLAALKQLRELYRGKARANGWTQAWLEALKDEFDGQEEAIKKIELAGAI